MASFRVKYFHSWRFLQRLVEWLQFLMMETWWVSKICLALLSQDLGACCCCSANSSSSVPNLTRAGWTRKLVWQCRYCKNLRVSLSLEMRVCARYKAVWWGRGNPVLQWREVFCTSSFGSGCVFGTAQSQILGQFRFLSCFKSSLWELSLQPWGSQLRFDWENDCSFFLPVTCATCKHWQPPELTGCLQGYVSPAMALWKHSEPLFDHLVPQTTLLPLQEELSCFPSVVFGSSHRKAIQAVKSFLIHYCGVLNKLTHGVGAAAERAVQKKERLSFPGVDAQPLFCCWIPMWACFVLLPQRLRRQHLLALPCAILLATDVLDLGGELLEVMWEAQTWSHPSLLASRNH